MSCSCWLVTILRSCESLEFTDVCDRDSKPDEDLRVMKEWDEISENDSRHDKIGFLTQLKLRIEIWTQV